MNDPYQDIEDITALKASKPFNRYWVRKLAEKLKDFEQSILMSRPDDPCTEAKHKRALIKELQNMMNSDESFLRKSIQSR